MRIALVHSFYRSAVPSGENTAVLLQQKALAEAGHEVLVVADRSDRLARDPVSQLRAGFRIATNIGRSPLDELNNFRPDLVHVHNVFPSWTEAWFENINAPVVKTVHNFRSFCAAGTLTREGNYCDLCPVSGSYHSVRHACYQGSALRTIPLAVASRKSSISRRFKGLAGMVFLTQQTKQMFEQFGAEVPLSAVIPNFVGATEPHDGKRQRVARKDSYWLFSGRLSEEKGIEELISAWPEGKRLLVAGSGPLEQKCRELGHNKDILFAGHLSQDALKNVIRGAIATLIPSRTLEQITFAYIEAIALGVPAIALANTSVATEIEANSTGVVFKNFSDLPSALSRLEENRETLARNARNRYFEEYCEALWVRRIDDFYSRIIHK